MNKIMYMQEVMHMAEFIYYVVLVIAKIVANALINALIAFGFLLHFLFDY